MPKSTVSSGAVALAEPENTTKTTYTKWDTFVKAGLAVKEIRCACLPGHPADESCKTAFVPTGANVISHMAHGGGFMFTVDANGRPWPGWKELEKAGVEIQYLRDNVTDHDVNISVRAIKSVLAPHQGKFRGAYQSFKNQLLFNLQFTPPVGTSDDFDNEYSD